jgi:hypothetical protein
VRAEAFEQTPERRLVPCEACSPGGCLGGISLGSEPVNAGSPVGVFEWSTTTEGHFSTPQVRCLQCKTLDLYGHLYPGDMDRYAERLDSAADQAGKAKSRPDDDESVQATQ